jgi:GNAT superfamily N-acetyltransferase
MEREGENNLILGTISRLVDGHIDRAEFMASVDENGVALGACVKVPLRGMTITRLPVESIPAIAEAAHDRIKDLSDILGPAEPARALSNAWAGLRGIQPRLWLRFRGYELERVIPAPPVSGGMVQAGPDDADRVSDWAAAMVEELEMHMPDAREQAREWVNRNESFLWHDERPVAMAQVQFPTPTCPRVRMVYTPPEARRHGYATSLVARLSERLLASGCPRCFLFTDIDNPTSNSIYMKIGYRPVCEWEGYRFSAE